jgi:hypothetical protein
MPTIVEYTNAKSPENRYPWYIVSPPRSGPCCFSEMEEIGEVQREEQWEWVYKRCRTCGFTVQVILRQLPDDALVARLRSELQRSFRRNVADCL